MPMLEVLRSLLGPLGKGPDSDIWRMCSHEVQRLLGFPKVRTHTFRRLVLAGDFECKESVSDFDSDEVMVIVTNRLSEVPKGDLKKLTLRRLIIHRENPEWVLLKAGKRNSEPKAKRAS